ncbi:MAG: GLPGLI family protein [Bacteroidota bacterium]
MRHLIFTLAFVALSISLSAQTVEVKYFEPDGMEADGRTIHKKATYTLHTTPGRSLFLEHPSEGKVVDNFDEGEFSADFGTPVELWLYKDFKTRELSYKVALMYGKRLKAEDKIVPIQWQLTKNQRSIGGIPCQEAIGTFRGRTYHAWFTYTIPISDGPWKLTGLPGLILEAYDEEKFVVFLFDGLRKTNRPIIKPREKLKTTDYRTAYDKVMDEYVKMVRFTEAKMKKEGFDVSVSFQQPYTRELYKN